jgi:hypothetical protein
MPITIGGLPHPSQIEHPELAAAAAKHGEAQAALATARRTLAKLDNHEREIAKTADAIEAEQAIAAGKPAPKTRKRLAEFDRQVEQAEHDARVALLAAQRAARELQATIDEHGAEWADRLQREADDADQAWTTAVDTLTILYAERVEAHRKLRAVGGTPSQSTGPAIFKPGEVADSVTGEKLSQAMAQMVLTPQARHQQRVIASPEVMLNALARMGDPEPIEPFIPGGDVAERIRKAMEHAESVQRGYSIEEAQSDAPFQAVDRGNYRWTVEPVGAGGES